METSKDVFLKRMFEYRIQYFIAGIMAFIFLCFWEYGMFLLNEHKNVTENFTVCGCTGEAIFLVRAIFNTSTYLYSKYLVKKYGADLFGDLDQNWLKEFQGFDSSAFGEIFTRLIRCRKILGPGLLAVLIVLTVIHTALATFVGLIYVIAYNFYRDTYLDTAIADKVPRSMGGGVVVSRIIDREFTDKIDQLSKNLEQAKKK